MSAARGAKRRVLYVSHGHPSDAPGGAEVYALELYRGMQAFGEFEPWLLARTGPPHSSRQSELRGTLLHGVDVDADPNQYLLYTDIADFDWLMLTNRNKAVATRAYREFLQTHRPDVVHFQHTLFLGVDLLLETRRTLPGTPIVFTLHEYLPICHRNGQMLRTDTDQPCLEASPRRCHTCFPDISPQSFFLRKRFIMSHLARVDVFLAPSRFLLERYVEWGIPRDRIRLEEYGRLPMALPPKPRPAPTRARFGFFGQLNAFKGINVLLEAMARLGHRDGASPHLRVHGANLHLTPRSFQDKFHALLAAAGASVTFAGPYTAAQLPALMTDVDWVVVPSIWWENSPLVIQEAFAHGRPVLCSDIGAMAEKVEDGVDGLHFRAGDPVSLAEVIRRAATSPELWEQLHRGIREVYDMKTHVTSLQLLYRELLER